MKKVFSLLLVLMLVLSIAVPGIAAGKAKTKIALNQKGTVTLAPNKTLQLTATVSTGAAVKWKSSKKSVADVDAGGLVTAHKEGKATITAKAGGKTAKVTIKVVDPLKPKKLTIGQGKKTTLYTGDKLTLVTRLAPETARSELTFKSSKKSVASVDDKGVVTARKKGKAKITVTCVKNKKAKATITVTVKEKIVTKPENDLLRYLGAYAKTTAKKLGLKKRTNFGSAAEYFWKSKAVELYCLGSYERGYVSGCTIKGKTKYNIAGITYGMSEKDVPGILAKNGFTTYASLNKWNKKGTITYDKPYLDAGIALDVTCKKGKVTYVYAIFYGDNLRPADAYDGLS